MESYTTLQSEIIATLEYGIYVKTPLNSNPQINKRNSTLITNLLGGNYGIMKDTNVIFEIF